MKFVHYEDDYLYYYRKPAGIPSSFWKEKSFLDYLEDNKDFISKQKKNFSKEEEYGLLNRLDNATTWLLYFAKSQEIKKIYKNLQQEWKVNKYYLLEVYGDIRYRIKENGLVINYPIAHHKYEKDRMVVVKTPNDQIKWEHRLHHVKTKILSYEWCGDEQTTTLIVCIEKWIRHQIRSHFSSIWYPIVWDSLYGKKKDPNKGNLHLYSVWLMVK